MLSEKAPSKGMDLLYDKHGFGVSLCVVMQI